MTEKKRFVASVDESCIVDNLDNKGLYSVVDTVECLNNLHEENEQLKTFLEAVREELSLADRDNTQLEKENEQLRTALKELKEIGDYQADRIQELNDENEQLKRKIQRERTATQKQHQKWSTQAEQQIQTLQKQLESEHQMLENAILLERTRMGQNALKQYKEAIQ